MVVSGLAGTGFPFIHNFALIVNASYDNINLLCFIAGPVRRRQLFTAFYGPEDECLVMSAR
ncbi:MAG TPA: hypothetical protein DD640_02305 [Clostridiales bacterium]|nr:hypothetical protein [Clostridiales bacterium]